MDLFLAAGSSLFLLICSFLCLSGGLGLLRFPDFYTRMHAVGVTETLATAMILIGLMLQSPDTLVLLKLMVILIMTLFISPTASHALAHAAIQNDLVPELDKQDDNQNNNEEVTPSNP